MIDFNELTQLLAQMAGKLKYFPGDVDARLGIADEISQMASNMDQVRWLVRRVPRLYSEWPGTLEMRAVFCSKFRPIDGFEAESSDPRYIDGIPSEREERNALSAADYKQLPAVAKKQLDAILAEAPETPHHHSPPHKEPTMREIEAEIGRVKAQQEANRKRAEEIQKVLSADSEADIERIKALRDQNRQRFSELGVTSEDAKR